MEEDDIPQSPRSRRVQPQFPPPSNAAVPVEEYIRDYCIVDILEVLMGGLIEHKPQDPLDWLVDFLDKKSPVSVGFMRCCEVVSTHPNPNDLAVPMQSLIKSLTRYPADHWKQIVEKDSNSVLVQAMLRCIESKCYVQECCSVVAEVAMMPHAPSYFVRGSPSIIDRILRLLKATIGVNQEESQAARADLFTAIGSCSLVSDIARDAIVSAGGIEIIIASLGDPARKDHRVTREHAAWSLMSVVRGKLTQPEFEYVEKLPAKIRYILGTVACKANPLVQRYLIWASAFLARGSKRRMHNIFSAGLPQAVVCTALGCEPTGLTPPECGPVGRTMTAVSLALSFLSLSELNSIAFVSQEMYKFVFMRNTFVRVGLRSISIFSDIDFHAAALRFLLSICESFTKLNTPNYVAALHNVGVGEYLAALVEAPWPRIQYEAVVVVGGITQALDAHIADPYVQQPIVSLALSPLTEYKLRKEAVICLCNAARGDNPEVIPFLVVNVVSVLIQELAHRTLRGLCFSGLNAFRTRLESYVGSEKALTLDGLGFSEAVVRSWSHMDGAK
eukprot:PhF_6_TR16990/c0_g1_i1/m.25698